MRTFVRLWYKCGWMEPETIRALFAALRDEQVDYVLVGALALDVLGIGRARSLWLEPGDPLIWDGLVRRWRLHRFFAREPLRARRPGVFKYRSIDEKQRQQA